MKKTLILLSACAPMLHAAVDLGYDGGVLGWNLLYFDDQIYPGYEILPFLYDAEYGYEADYHPTYDCLTAEGNTSYNLVFCHPGVNRETETPNFTLMQAIYLNQISTYAGGGITAVTINMDHSGSMTAAGTMDFGSNLTTLTLMATLSDAQIAQLSNGEVITRTLLSAGNGILNYNDSVATNLTLSGVEGYNFVGQVMSADQLKEGEYGYEYSDTESADSISMVVKGKNGSAEAPDFGDGNVPEPTTATLSLMALAALAARRRRK